MSNYVIEVYNDKEIVCKISVEDKVVLFRNITKELSLLPFGTKLFVGYKDLLDFFRRRCTSCDGDLEETCRKTKGILPSDSVWLNFIDIVVKK